MTRISLLLAAGVSAVALASAAQAADLIIEEPAIVPMVEDYAGNWDGFYLGIFGGYAVGEVSTDDFGGYETDLDGQFIGGLNAGVDFTLTDGIIVGIVGDVEYLGLEGIAEDVLPGNDVSFDASWAASLRGKLGFDGGAFLPYLTAGLAAAEGTVEGSGGILSGQDTATHFGWTAGAGVEFAVTEDVSIDLLYRYSDYGSQEYTIQNGGADVSGDVGFTTHQVTAGLNWRF